MDYEKVDDALDLAFGDEWDRLACLNSLEESDSSSQTGLSSEILERIVAAVRLLPVRQE